MKVSKRFLSGALCTALIAATLVSCGDGGKDASSAKSGSKSVSASSGSSSTASAFFDASGRTEAQKASFEKYGHYGNPDLGYETMSGERDPWLWPFSRDSIWNMPIGSDAKYEDAGIRFVDEYGIDEEYLLTTTESDEQLEIYETNMHNRWPDVSTLKKSTVTTYWPKGFRISADLDTNTCSAILQPDGRTIIQMQPTCRATSTSTYATGYPTKGGVDIYDEGSYGSHWGSSLSTLGGSIRVGELTGDGQIHHALKIMPYAKTDLHFDWEDMGFKWPATTADGYASDTYGGTNPNVLMGSLLAIDPSATVESLGITTEVGKKLFFALQNYGAYIVDDSFGPRYNFGGDINISAEVKKAYGINLWAKASKATDSQNAAYAKDMKALIDNLKVVTNNSKKRVGGGGTPRQPLAPNLPSVK